jgi:hypothetical protein
MKKVKSLRQNYLKKFAVHNPNRCGSQMIHKNFELICGDMKMPKSKKATLVCNLSDFDVF